MRLLGVLRNWLQAVANSFRDGELDLKTSYRTNGPVLAGWQDRASLQSKGFHPLIRMNWRLTSGNGPEGKGDQI